MPNFTLVAEMRKIFKNMIQYAKNRAQKNSAKDKVHGSLGKIKGRIK